MKIHKEGYKILTVSTISLALLNVILFFIAGNSLLFYFILIASTIFFLIILNFFRSPSRIFPYKENGLIATPADGTIVVIENVKETEFFNEERLQISIFMSVFNAHINWIPIDGKIIHSSYHPGRFMAAYLPKSSTENERSTVVIETENGEKILLRQIAGALAKRIVTYPKEGNKCKINEQLGFIKFGSRVDIFLPLGSEVLVEMDQKVYGNKTALARIPLK